MPAVKTWWPILWILHRYSFWKYDFYFVKSHLANLCVSFCKMVVRLCRLNRLRSKLHLRLELNWIWLHLNWFELNWGKKSPSLIHLPFLLSSFFWQIMHIKANLHVFIKKKTMNPFFRLGLICIEPIFSKKRHWNAVPTDVSGKWGQNSFHARQNSWQLKITRRRCFNRGIF